MRITARLTIDVTYEVADDDEPTDAKSDIEHTLLAVATRAYDDGMLSGDSTGEVVVSNPSVTFPKTDNYTGGFRVRCTIGEKEVSSLRYLREAYGKTYPTWEAASLEGNMLQDTAAHVGLTDHPCYNPVRI